jgi:hypothetical protein
MRTTIFAAATAIAAMAAFAAPAQANEARVGIHGGVIWGGGDEEAVIGAQAGYDFDLGAAAFAGVEGSVDKVLEDDTDLIGALTGRVGAKVGERGKAYVLGGYTFTEGEDLPHAGVGYQHRLGGNMFVNAEYRHYFSDFTDGNSATVGVGVTF